MIIAIIELIALVSGLGILITWLLLHKRKQPRRRYYYYYRGSRPDMPEYDCDCSQRELYIEYSRSRED